VHNAKKLRELTDRFNKDSGEKFAKEMISKIENCILHNAQEGKYEFTLSEHHPLNSDRWLTKDYMCKPIIEHFKSLEYDAIHSNDLREGIYLKIRW
jgi:hypothetical protein